MAPSDVRENVQRSRFLLYTPKKPFALHSGAVSSAQGKSEDVCTLVDGWYGLRATYRQAAGIPGACACWWGYKCIFTTCTLNGFFRPKRSVLITFSCSSLRALYQREMLLFQFLRVFEGLANPCTAIQQQAG